MSIWKTLFGTLVLILSAHFTFAQSVNVPSGSLQKLWSLQFAVGNNLVVSSFDNYSLSLKRKISKCISIRTGIGGSFSHLAGWYDNDGYGDNFVKEDIDIQFESLIIYNFRPESVFNIYAGAGPVINFTYLYDDTYDLDRTVVERTSTWNTGINLVLGAEWHFMPDMSVFGEYQLTMAYTSSNYKSDSQDFVHGSTSQSGKSGTLFRLKANMAAVGLSVYF